MQRPTARHAERESKLEVSIKSLPSELSESHRRGGRKRVKAGGEVWTEGMEDTRRARPPESTEQVLLNSQGLKQQAQGLLGHTRPSVYILWFSV